MDRLNFVIAVSGDRDLTEAALRIAPQLARTMNGQTGECFPRLSTLQERTGLGKTAVIEGVKALEAQGWLQVERTHRQPNRYHFNLDKVAQVLGSVTADPSEGLRSVTADPVRSVTADPNTRRETLDSSSLRSEGSGQDPDLFASKTPPKPVDPSRAMADQWDPVLSPRSPGKSPEDQRRNFFQQFHRLRGLAGNDLVLLHRALDASLKTEGWWYTYAQGVIKREQKERQTTAAGSGSPAPRVLHQMPI